MKLKSVNIRNFKRFTDLAVWNIPETARLIMLAGPNGCGKSSFFDALNTWHVWNAGRGRLWQEDYHLKAGSRRIHRNILDEDHVKVDFHIRFPEEDKKKLFYFRSAYRNDPEFTSRRLERTGDLLDEPRPERMIDNDIAVSKNYQRMVSESVEYIFGSREKSLTIDQFQDQLVGKISDPLCKLFPDLKLNGLGNPIEDGTFRFTKGASKRFAFKNLSGGEKAAFDLILDLVVAKRRYDNTIFCIDEPESHINPSIQAKLLFVLYDLIPENCQLMLATHSIGMMRRACDIESKHPGSVVFLDFGDLDFDKRQNIEPTKPNRAFWTRVYEVALSDLAELVAPRRVVICEGQPLMGRPVSNHSHDAKCYERIFQDEFPETRFVSMGNDREILQDRRALAEALRLLISGLQIIRLVDRDDRSPEEIEDAKKEGVKVLSRRNLESYLFDDEVLEELATAKGKEDNVNELLEEKEKILTSMSNRAKDDLKPASGRIYLECKKVLGLVGCGNNAETFMRDTLAPLIKPEMSVYKQLKQDIFNSDSL